MRIDAKRLSRTVVDFTGLIRLYALEYSRHHRTKRHQQALRRWKPSPQYNQRQEKNHAKINGKLAEIDGRWKYG